MGNDLVTDLVAYQFNMSLDRSILSAIAITDGPFEQAMVYFLLLAIQ